MKTNTRAPWRPQETILAGQAASRAGRRHDEKLKDRLGDRFFDELDAAIENLQQLLTGRRTSLEAMKAETLELKQSLAETHACLVAFRSAIAARYPKQHAMRALFGLGIKTNAGSMSATLSALHLFIEAMEQCPAEAAAASLGPKDLAKLKGHLARIPDVNNSQEARKHARKTATARLESANYAVYSMLNLLKIAAAIDLADDPGAQNEIVGPMPFGRRRRRRSGGEPAEE